MKKAGHKLGKIANVLERSKSTISWELASNRGQPDYRLKQAQRIAWDCREMNARMIDDATWQFVQEKHLQQ